VRRHAKASSATSNARRGAPHRAHALAHGRLTALTALALAALLVFATPASAEPLVTENYANFGPDGTEATDFEMIGGVAVDQQTGVVYVLDSYAGTLSKFEADGTPLDFTGTAPYIDANKIEGLSPSIELSQAQVAVDSASHVVYVTEEHSIRAFQADGEAAKFTLGPNAGASEIAGFGSATGVAVDTNGAIYVSDQSAEMVSVYASSGDPLTTFPAEKAANLAVASDGVVYVDNPTYPNDGVYKFVPNEFPVTVTTTYKGSSTSLPDGSASFAVSVGVDPINGDVYVLETGFSGGWLRQFDKEGTFLRFIGSNAEEEEAELAGLPQGVAVVGGGEEFQLYVGNSDTSGSEITYSKVAIFGEKIIEGPPAIRSTSSIDLDSRTATLRAQINPSTFASAYHFEYGSEDCSVSACTSTPDGAIVAGHRYVGVSQEIAGLEPGTTYHYRVVARNVEGTTEGPDKTFTTPLSGLGFGLADNRAWEMVSPPNKMGGKIAHFSQGVMQGAADGNGLVYQSVTPIDKDAEGNLALEISIVLARRGTGGWSSKDLTPPRTAVSPIRLGGEYKTFSPNLGSALFEQAGDMPLSPEASEETPYLRQNSDPPTYRPLVTSKEGYANVPPGTVFGGNPQFGDPSPVAVVAADPSLTHPVLQSNKAPLVAGAALGSLYQWDEGQLQPVSELPASEGGGVVAGTAGAGLASIRNAVAADGSRVFWGPGEYGNMSGLYVRDTANQETWRLDVKQSGASGAGEVHPAFEGASADGTVVFFSTQQQLTADASAPEAGTRDLYRCEVGPLEGGDLGCASLIDLSAPIAGSGERAELVGIVPGLSEDGSRVYFVARGALDATPNEAGDSAVAGAHNLYLWEEGQGRRFIATLSNRDNADWGSSNVGATPAADRFGQAADLSAASSPNGRYFVFMSERNLTGYDNRDAESEEPVEEVLRYDAVADRLECVSCKPSGASPEGRVSKPGASRADTHSLWPKRWVAAILPAAQESEVTVGLTFHQPRVVLDNGRVIFNAIDTLVSADANGEWDVYQYEPTGVGDCTISSSGAAIARSGGGCVSLLSSGTAEEEATFLDASETGDDVFFLTPARLSVTDEDEELDVYDARVDGVPATLPVINECLGEACQPPPNPPNDPTPASAAFHGSGNVPSERCPQSKRKVIRAGSAKCVAKKHKQKKRSHRKAKRAGSKRRAHR
jgi:hypothetical protein